MVFVGRITSYEVPVRVGNPQTHASFTLVAFTDGERWVFDFSWLAKYSYYVVRVSRTGSGPVGLLRLRPNMRHMLRYARPETSDPHVLFEILSVDDSPLDPTTIGIKHVFRYTFGKEVV